MATAPATTTMVACPQTPRPRPSRSRPATRRSSALRRSRSDRKLAGVAGGLGRWAGIDPLIFRILFVVLVVFGGSGLLFYALGWLLVPDDGETESEGQRLFHGSSRSVISVLALVVVLVLGLALTGSLIDSGPGHGGLGVLIVVGVVIVLLVRNGQRPTWSPPPAADGTTPAEPGSYGQTPGTAYAVSPASSSTAPTAPLPPPTGGPSYPPPGGPSYPAYAGYAPHRLRRHPASGRSSAGSRSARCSSSSACSSAGTLPPSTTSPAR